jgi:hypothetical protein
VDQNEKRELIFASPFRAESESELGSGVHETRKIISRFTLMLLVILQRCHLHVFDALSAPAAPKKLRRVRQATVQRSAVKEEGKGTTAHLAHLYTWRFP